MARKVAAKRVAVKGECHIVLPDWRLDKAAGLLARAALKHAGGIEEAAALMGLTSKALERIMAHQDIEWPPPRKGKAKPKKGE